MPRTSSPTATVKKKVKKADETTSIRTFRAALTYLSTLTNFEKSSRVRYNEDNFSLSRMKRILASLGNPHTHFKTAHVGGTKGKGSTVAMLSAMLTGSGNKTGMYTSPHVMDVRERIAIDGELISEKDFTRHIALAEAAATKARIAKPTYFEILTAAAMSYFSEEEVDFAVIEVGLGGRLDSTNVITPEVVGLVQISFDHMALLGNTLEKIAKEKAGIIKPGIPVVSVPQPVEVRAVFSAVAEEVGAPIHFAEEDSEYSYRFEFSHAAGRHARICVSTASTRFDHLEVPLMGEHQATNCGLALSMLDVLKSRGVKVDDHAAIRNLHKVNLVGRMEIINERPRIIVDGAHNAQSVAALMKTIGQHIPYDSMIVIFGCHRDKDIPGMIRRIQLGADKIIFTSVKSPRSADPAELASEYMERSGKMAQVAATLEDAMQIALSAVTRDDLICITGSFTLVGEAKRKLTGTVTL